MRTTSTTSSFEHFLQAHQQVHFNWKIEPNTVGIFQGNAVGQRYGQVTFSQIAIDPAKGQRTNEQINPVDENFLVLIRVTSGSMEVAQAKYEGLIQPRDVFVWDALKHCDFISHESMRCQAILFPRHLAAAYVDEIEHLSGLILRPDNASSTLLSSHIEALHNSMVNTLPQERQGLIHATLSILSAAAATSRHWNVSRYQELILQRLLSEINEHYHDPDFTPDAAAQRLQLSPRYLRKILAASGNTFSALLKKKRLQHAAAALANPLLAQHVSITEIAFRTGFSDSAHFSRLFKAEFSCSPSQFRLDANQRRS